MSTGLREGMAAIAQQGLQQPQETLSAIKQKNNSLFNCIDPIIGGFAGQQWP
jgi:hypothetical protein